MLRHIQALLPQEPLIYFADQAHVPYGSRSPEEIRRLSEAVTRFLLLQGAKLVVVACNTASGAALSHLRHLFPEIPFVGMEPAVKPAARLTKSGKVGVLATEGTFESQRYVELMSKWASGVEVLESPCLGLVERIESGEIDSAATERLLRGCLEPMLAADVDTVVLGCTHYPLVLPLINRIVADAAVVIDPAPAVARQTQRVLNQRDLHATAVTKRRVSAITSGDVLPFSLLASRLLNQTVETSGALWRGGNLATA